MIDAVVGDIDGVWVNGFVERGVVWREIEHAIAIAIDVGSFFNQKLDGCAEQGFTGQKIARSGKARCQDAHKEKTENGAEADASCEDAVRNMFAPSHFAFWVQEPSEEKPAGHGDGGDASDGEQNDVAVPLKCLLDHAPDTANAGGKIEKVECVTKDFSDLVSKKQVGGHEDDPGCGAPSQHGRLVPFAKKQAEHADPEAAKCRGKDRQSGDKPEAFPESGIFDGGQPSHASKDGESGLKTYRFDGEGKDPE